MTSYAVVKKALPANVANADKTLARQILAILEELAVKLPHHLPLSSNASAHHFMKVAFVSLRGATFVLEVHAVMEDHVVKVQTELHSFAFAVQATEETSVSLYQTLAVQILALTVGSVLH
jgi:hypothetical protein